MTIDSTTDFEKPQPDNSFRVRLTVATRQPRIDQVLLEHLRTQERNLDLKNISRTKFKALFKDRKIRIKGQSAVPSSALAQGTTTVDIMGFTE